ncbi:MAG: hypothetical protein WEA24_18545 [Gemmatimonadota bacterium]
MPLLAVVSGACATDGPAGAGGVQVRDSAGVRIVESAAVPRLALADEPELSIGAVEGAPALLFGPNLSGLLLEDGGVAVAELTAREIRFFDAGGAHLRTVGGRGGAPGEFAFLGNIQRLSGDTVLALDSRSNRWTWATAGDGIVRTLTEPRGPRMVLGTGRAVRLEFQRAEPGPPNVITRDRVEVIVFRPGEPAEDTLTTLPWVDVYFAPPEVAGTPRPQQITIPYGRKRPMAGGLDRFFTGSGDPFQVEVVDAASGLVELWRRPWTPLPVTDAMIEDVVEGRGRVPPSMAGLVEAIRRAPRPAAASAYEELRAGGDGSVWARHARLFRADPVVWSVFAPDGTLRGELTLPDNVSLADPREDRALVVWRDALDVPFLRVYRVVP